MVQFEMVLREQKLPEWSQFYFDYGGLKVSLRELKKCYKAEDEDITSNEAIRIRRTSSFSTRQLSDHLNLKEEQFSKQVDNEVEKVVLFFLAQQGEIANRLLHLKLKFVQTHAASYLDDDIFESSASFHHIEIAEYVHLYKDLVIVGNDLKNLLQYLRLNVSGLRKILKKHDKQIRKRMIASHYLTSRARVRYSFLQQLYHNEGIIALVGTLSNMIENLEPYVEETAENTENTHRETQVLEQLQESLYLLSAEQKRTVVDYLSFGSDIFLALTPLDEMTNAEVEEMKQRKLDPWSAYINLFSTFMYMANYYIVGPTSAEYAEALGGNAAMSGAIIGMTPIAACVSCVLYSYWTNTSFRHPLLFCFVLLSIGNTLYSLALSFQSFWMVIAGRVLIGLGGARGLNRRYITDTVPIRERTFFSAAFVAASAIGTSFGPACAALLTYVDFEIGIIKINAYTSPGWLMLVSWVIIGIATFLKFKEPSRRVIPSVVRKTSEEPAYSPAIISNRKSYKVDDAYDFSHNIYSDNGKTEVSIYKKDSSDESTLLLNADSKSKGASSSNDSKKDKASGGSILGHISVPLLFALYCYFMNKLVTEAAVNSAPLLTKYFFSWEVSEVGMLMAVLGIITLPVSIGVGKLSLLMEDRLLMQCICVAASLGCLILANFSNEFFDVEYTDLQYVIGVSVIFVSLQAHEGVLMSITSKVISPSLAKGTFNSGFLATEAGTAARFCGDIAITAVGVHTVDQLLNLLFIPSFLLIASLILGTWWYYPLLDV